MADWLGPARQQFFYTDDDGAQQPCAGWLMFHYEPNSDDFKDTWQDPEEDSLNTNPVILDENGEASIFGNGLYRQRFTNADESVERWDRVTRAGTGEDVTPTTYTDYFDMPFEFLGDLPTASQPIGAFNFTRAAQIPADFSGAPDGRPFAVGWQVTAPADADVLITVKRGTVGSSVGSETTIGTITVAQTTGLWTWLTTSNLPQAFDPEDYLKFYAPVTPDSAWKNIFWNVPGDVL